MFGNEAQIGKSALTDLQEAKKTLLIWRAYHSGNNAEKRRIEKVFIKRTVQRSDLEEIKKIVVSTGALAYARDEIAQLTDTLHRLHTKSRMKTAYKHMLSSYARSILSL